MNPPEQTFKLKTELSKWSGTKTVSGWFALFELARCAIVATLIITGKEKGLGELAAPTFMIVACLLLRTKAKREISRIETELCS